MTIQPEFTVLVSPACLACAGAHAVTELFAQQVGASMRVIDVNEASDSLPSGFIGTPMVYLGDTLVSVGTPTRAQLEDAYAREERR